jgi:uncharacterized protein YutE (UPF0331/DUF86 family)
MDLMKRLVALSHKEFLATEALRRYPIDNPDDEAEVALMMDLRNNFIGRYDKVNNRQFIKVKTYKIEEYQKANERYERKIKIRER